MGECFQSNTNGQCSKGDSCSFSHELATRNSVGVHRRKGQSSSPTPKAQIQTDGEGQKHATYSGNRDESSSDTRSKILCRCRNCNNPSCGFGHPPVCLRLDAKLATHVIFQMLRQMRSPTESQRMKESIQLGCVFQDSHPRKPILRKSENWDQITPSNSPRARGTREKFGKERVHHEASVKSVNSRAQSVCSKT